MEYKRNPYVLALSAGLSGIAEALTTHPLDRMKTEMQRLALDKSKANIQAGLTSIYRTGGVSNFYAGLVPRLVGIVPMRLTYWSTLKTMNDLTKGQNRFLEFVAPGLVAGAVQTVIDNPIEVFKTKLMTGATTVRLANLFDGFTPTILRNITFAIVVGASTKLFGQDRPFLAGACGGFMGSIISHPFDVVKTEMQRHISTNAQSSHVKPGFLAILTQIYHRNPMELFAGMSMRCCLGFASMGVGFMALSHIQRFLYKFVFVPPSSNFESDFAIKTEQVIKASTVGKSREDFQQEMVNKLRR
jgi:hypothetical protein